MIELAVVVDDVVRSAVFLWLQEQADIYDYVIPRTVLEQGINLDGTRITIIGAAGIWKPRVCELPLSITSTSNGPYEDGFNDQGLLRYKYRGTDPHHRDNVGLRRLSISRTPLVYFHGIVPGKYVPIWPVFIAEDRPNKLECLVAIDPAYASSPGLLLQEPDDENFLDDSSIGIRRYVAAFTKRRLHQHSFRERVIRAYSSTCVICRLRHPELLDAAHIIPDSELGGDPIVPNGLCLCKIHHAAFDRNIFGISPDYEAHVRPDILLETDGPMLKHGLQEIDGMKIVLPQRKIDLPDRDRLHQRYEVFRKAV